MLIPKRFDGFVMTLTLIKSVEISVSSLLMFSVKMVMRDSEKQSRLDLCSTDTIKSFNVTVTPEYKVHCSVFKNLACLLCICALINVYVIKSLNYICCSSYIVIYSVFML